MPEENWTFGVGSVSADPLWPLSASSTSSPLIAGRTDTVTVLILSLPLLGRKMCLNLWRYLFPIVSVRLWKLSSRIMSPSLICLPVSSAILSEVRFWCETQQLQKKKKNPSHLATTTAVSSISDSLVIVTGLESCEGRPTLPLPVQLSFLFSPQRFSASPVRSHVHIPSSGPCDVRSPLRSLLPFRIF